MPIPSYQEIYKALLPLTSDVEIRTLRQVRDSLTVTLSISDDDKAQFLPSGTQKVWDSRVGWAKTYLVKAGLLRQLGRGLVQIADRGHDVLQENPAVLDDKYLLQYPEFREFSRQ